MLVVIAKEIAGNKGQKMIFTLRSGVMAIVVLASVRQVGSEIEQLEGRQKRRNDPEQDQGRLGDPDRGNIECDGRQDNLPPGDVFLEKIEIPTEEAWVTIMEVRVMRSPGMFVMVVVLWAEDIVGIENEQCRTNLANEVIELLVFGSYCPMHGVVGCDKQTCK